MNEQFRRDVEMGLSSSPRYLSSKYFYDREGDLLFLKITELPEYYLAGCEHEILSRYRQELLEHFNSGCERFHLIEFGAGDARKTRVLIRHFLDMQAQFEYNPIDISENAIQNLSRDIGTEFPELPLAPLNLEYFEAVKEIGDRDACRKVILFLGSNIGNFNMEEAAGFFTRLGTVLGSGDQLLTGFDLRKDPQTILAAYNDSKGVTSEFNLNLLRRINLELDADFDTEAFYHYPVYDPENGTARSYLVSRKTQEVNIAAIPMRIRFGESEPVLMEISQKYTPGDILNFADQAGFRLIKNFFDGRKYFVNSLWEKE